MIFSQPIPEEHQNGEGFGYVVAFRPVGKSTWKQAVMASAEASKYTFKNDSLPPLGRYAVKVGVYNNMGDGPFSDVAFIYSAEEGE